MASPAKLIRLKAVQAERLGRAIAQIQKEIFKLGLLVDNLNREISAEEARSRIYDPANIAYSTFAKATIQRRSNLLQSIARLTTQLEATKDALREKNEELQAAKRLMEAGSWLRDDFVKHLPRPIADKVL